MSEHAIAGRAFSPVCEVCRNGSDVSGVSWGVLWYNSCAAAVKKRTTTLRGAAVHVCVRYAWFCFWEPQPDIGARRGTVRSRRASRSGIAELGPRRPKPVRNAFIRPHRIDASLSSTFTHIGDRHSPDGEASMQTRETQAFLFPTERGA